MVLLVDDRRDIVLQIEASYLGLPCLCMKMTIAIFHLFGNVCCRNIVFARKVM